MTQETINMLIIATPPTILALASFVASVMNSFKLKNYHEQINGRMEQFIGEVRSASYARGQKQAHDSAAAAVVETNATKGGN
jgi:hypothetical protein